MKFGVQPWSKNKISVYCHTFETKLPHSCPISVEKKKKGINGPRLDPKKKKYSNIDSMLLSKDHPKNDGTLAPIFCQMFHFFVIASTPRMHRVIVLPQECRPDAVFS